MTYEQSLEKIERIKEAIAEATSKRNYNEAKILESYLEKHEKIHERLFSKRKAQLIKERLSELESEKLQRQAELVEQVIIRLNNIYDTYDRNYADLERRHMMNLENLKSRFNRPVFTNMKISSTIRNLCAAEKYYANVMKDFQTAAQIKKQIEIKKQQIHENSYNNKLINIIKNSFLCFYIRRFTIIKNLEYFLRSLGFFDLEISS